MKTITFAIASLVIVSGSSSWPATAGRYHNRKVAPATVSERVRNAQAYSAPTFGFARDGGHLDEALAPPAGR